MISLRAFAKACNAVLVAIAVSGCGWYRAIEGSGHVVAQGRSSATFHRIALEGDAEVQIARGEAAITVLTDDNLFPYVQTRIVGDELRISEEDSKGGSVQLKPTDGVRIIVTMPDAPTGIALSGSGSIASGETWTAAALKIDISGSGDIDLTANASELDAAISGSGSIRLRGAADSAVVDISGSGELHAFDLASKGATVDISGDGRVEVSVSASLQAAVTGSGTVVYRGSPPLVAITVTGLGSVRRY